jgi:hypothetical protein
MQARHCEPGIEVGSHLVVVSSSAAIPRTFATEREQIVRTCAQLIDLQRAPARLFSLCELTSVRQ